MAKLSDNAVTRLKTATANQAAGNEIADAINKGEAVASQSVKVIVAAIVATAVSQTTDFGALKVGDQVLMIPATAGNADLITISTVGDLGQAAVIGNIYVALRSPVLPAAETKGF